MNQLQTSVQKQGFLSYLSSLGSLVKFSHTIFALPFAMSMLVLLAGDGRVSFLDTCSILLALVSARTAAMAFNRLVDQDIDSENPRTHMRELPQGTVSRSAAWSLCIAASLLFFFASYALGMHCLLLSPLVLGVLFVYSVSKRVTSNAHFILGLALALAPGGVWYAITASLAVTPLYLMAGVLFWVAGFDVLYSCQDESFDKEAKLHSIPVRFGTHGAFVIAKLSHVTSVLFLIAFGLSYPCSYAYFIGVCIFAGFLFSQYLLVSPDSLEKIDVAFFSRNGMASVLFFVCVCLDTFLKIL